MNIPSVEKKEDAAWVVVPDRANCSYTANYCEENIWKLCEYVKEKNPNVLEKCFCVFISNDNKQIPLWKQKASDQPDKPVVWDYHVIFIYSDVEGTLVYDFDTTLPFPCDFTTYCSKGIGDDHTLQQCYKRKFRVTDGDQYLLTFASDRSHMRSGGCWLSPPPQYPCIQTEMSTHNIDDFISMDASKGFGTVLDYSGKKQNLQTAETSTLLKKALCGEGLGDRMAFQPVTMVKGIL